MLGASSYDVFISYSHRDALDLGVAVQTAMHRLAKPWYRLRALRAFLDQTDLAATPKLWPDIERALLSARYLVIIGSPEAAKSQWIEREIRAWLDVPNRRARIILVLAQGTIAWSSKTKGFDWSQTDALPRILEGAFDSEPLWIDLRFASAPDRRDLRNPEFTRSIARVIAPIRGIDVATLISTDYREHKKAIRLAWSAVGLLLALTIASLGLYVRAERARADAEAQRALALERLQDARVGQARVGMLSQQFELTAKLLSVSKDDDDRLRLARWVASQHRAYATRLTPKFTPRGIGSLVVHPVSGELVGIEDSSYSDSKPRLVAIDPQGPSIIAETAAPAGGRSITAASAPHTFFVVGGGVIARAELVGASWVVKSLATKVSLRDVAWFKGSEWGVGLRGGQLIALHAVGAEIRMEPMAHVGTRTALRSAPDARHVTVALPHDDNGALAYPWRQRVLSIVSLRGGRPVSSIVDPARAYQQLVGGGLSASLDEGNHLTVRPLEGGYEIRTREIFFKGSLGRVLKLPESLLVQEVGDTNQHAVASMAVLDVGTGENLLSPFPSPEPIWGSAFDARKSYLYMSGQDGWLLEVAVANDRVTSRPLAHEAVGPMLVDEGTVLFPRANDFMEHAFEMSLHSLEVREKPSRFKPLIHTLPNGWYTTYHHCPFIAAVSPDRRRLAFTGTTLWVAELTPAEHSDALAGKLDVAAVCQRVIESETAVWRVNIDPPQNVRWVSNKIVVAHGFHGNAIRIDADAKTQESILEPETVDGLSQLGSVLISMLSGTIYEVTPDGNTRLYARIPNLFQLFPLDSEGRFYAGAMTEPPRTAFLARNRRGEIEEVASIPNPRALLDARVVDGQVVLLYDKSLRVYAQPLPQPLDRVGSNK